MPGACTDCMPGVQDDRPPPQASPCDVAALQKCLADNKVGLWHGWCARASAVHARRHPCPQGDKDKCAREVQSFQTACAAAARKRT